ncbi:MAG: SRPBCC family protein [Acidimicrobiales bacterium]
MTEISRQVRIDAAPMEVAAALASSPWRAALSIDPVGAGSRVNISAAVEPEQLAMAVEAAALAEVCALQSHFSSNQETPNNARTHNQHPKQHLLRRTNMTTINRSVTINASAEEVWPALADFGGIAAWNPNVKTSKLTSSQQLGEGITRECQLFPMGTVQERVSEWTDGRMMTIDIYEFRNVPAMRSASAVLELEPNGANTRVNIAMTYEVGLGPLGAGMNAMMMKRQFERTATSMMAGLKHHVETGQDVGRKTDLPLQAVSA